MHSTGLLEIHRPMADRDREGVCQSAGEDLFSRPGDASALDGNKIRAPEGDVKATQRDGQFI